MWDRVSIICSKCSEKKKCSCASIGRSLRFDALVVRESIVAWSASVSNTKQMTKTTIRFKAKLFQPTESEKAGSWNFLVVPKNASAKLPSRGMTAIEGTINGFAFQATLEPDGQKSHWLKVDRKLSKSAGADAGDIVALEIAPAGKETEPEVPTELRKALAVAAPEARVLWSEITPH